MPKIVELRQDRSLFRSNFEGYKLALETVPQLSRDLTYCPFKAEANEDQYSLHHAELFCLQNLLQSDPWSRTTTFFVNTAGEVVRSGYDENTGRPDVLQVVFRVKDSLGFGEGRTAGDYNYSMRFISEKYCVLCDGIKKLLLLDTGDRLKINEWKVIAQTDILVDGAVDERNYLIYECRLDTTQEQKEISMILGRVEREEPSEKDGVSTHFMHLHWAQWLLKDTWTFSVLDTLEGKGSIYYCAFQPHADALILSSNHEFAFRSKLRDVPIDMTVAEKPHLHDAAGEESFSYTWSQSDDDVVIKFDIREGKDKTDYIVKCIGDKLTVKCNDEVLFDSTFSEKLDQDLTTWTIENNFLQVTLIKQTANHSWTSLLANNAGPKETADSRRQCDLAQEGIKPIANLELPVEDCDFPIGASEDEIKISRFHLPSKSITHTVLMGSTPPLFTTNLRPGYPLALATRQDVDVCLWLQQYNASKPEEWSLRHEGNLYAFGYVQASKPTKFMDCSPDLNYSIICEAYKHIYIYKRDKEKEVDSGFSLGKQQLITIKNSEEILGLATAPNVVTILMENSILYLQIN